MWSIHRVVAVFTLAAFSAQEAESTAPDLSTNCTAVTLKESDPKENFAVINVAEAKTYAIVNQTGSNPNFTIGRDTGALSVSNNDFESLPINVFKVTITANDTGGNTASKLCVLSVTIEDVNDNSPTFNQSSYKITLNPVVANGTSIFNISATDKDKTPKFKTIVYSLNGTDSGNFSIDKSNGEIKAKTNLSQDIQKYEIGISASDGTTKPGYATLTVCIGSCPTKSETDGNGADHINTTRLASFLVCLFPLFYKWLL